MVGQGSQRFAPGGTGVQDRSSFRKVIPHEQGLQVLAGGQQLREPRLVDHAEQLAPDADKLIIYGMSLGGIPAVAPGDDLPGLIHEADFAPK